ncbi:MAG TPA: peptidylprolyl isomerase [Frankiaceae bacterium]|nr:peptidylprolyl isomerase [Frankiaceae bacterium]
MPSSQREQQLARARAARRAQRQQERTKRRRLVAAVLAGVLVLAAVGVGLAVGFSGDDNKSSVTATKPSASATPTASASASASAGAITTTACGAAKPALAPATRTFKAEPPLTINTAATYTMTLNTSCGPITIALEAAKAPHTVNLLSFLATEHFFDGTRCHRSTSDPSLTVLQCGDPTGTGSGQIGFSIAEENTKGATYTRGTFAMANTGAAKSTQSQFFLVDKDSTLPANYTVAGHITTGLAVLDKILALGNDGSNGTGDGAPKQNVYLNTVTVTKS